MVSFRILKNPQELSENSQNKRNSENVGEYGAWLLKCDDGVRVIMSSGKTCSFPCFRESDVFLYVSSM